MTSAQQQRKRWGWPALAALVVLAMMAIAIHFAGRGDNPAVPGVAPPLDVITVNVVTYIGSAPLYVAQAKGYFREQGLEVHIVQFAYGKASLEGMMANRAEFAMLGEIPMAVAALRGDDIGILAALFSGSQDYGVIARTASGVTKVADLRGKKVAVVPATSTQLMLDLLLSSNGIASSDVQRVEMKKDQDMTAALANGEVAAVSSIQPNLARMQAALGKGNSIIFESRELFSATFMLTGRRPYLQAHPEVQAKMLRALIQSVAFMKANPDEAIGLFAPAIGGDQALTRKLWPGYRFQVRLDQSMIIALEETARWAIRNQLISASVVPDFQALVAPEALMALDPARVNLIQQMMTAIPR